MALLGIVVSLGLLTTVAPPGSATISHAQPTPTAAERAQAAVARKVFIAGHGRTLDFRKALQVAGPKRKRIAQDFALGMLSQGGRVTHVTAKQKKQLAARLRVLQSRAPRLPLAASGPGETLRPDPGDPCPGVNSLNQYWYGWRLRLDACNVSELTHIGATVAFLGGALGTIFTLDVKSKGVMAVALIIVAAGTFALETCGRRGRGVKIYKYMTGVVSGWCLSQ